MTEFVFYFFRIFLCAVAYEIINTTLVLNKYRIFFLSKILSIAQLFSTCQTLESESPMPSPVSRQCFFLPRTVRAYMENMSVQHALLHQRNIFIHILSFFPVFLSPLLSWSFALSDFFFFSVFFFRSTFSLRFAKLNRTFSLACCVVIFTYATKSMHHVSI